MGAVVRKFFADRGTHLAAMIAYFALLSFVPLLLLSLALLGLVHQADEGSFFVRQLEKTFPNTSLDSILRAVRAIQSNAAALGRSAPPSSSGRRCRSSRCSRARSTSCTAGRTEVAAREGARDDDDGRLARLAVRVARDRLDRAGDPEAVLRLRAATTRLARVIAIAVSTAGLFLFLSSAYYVLTNADLTRREVLPGAVTAAIILEATFQFLPVYVDISKHNPVLQTLSGPAILLVWLYVMANVIVLGAEVNWWRAGRALPADAQA